MSTLTPSLARRIIDTVGAHGTPPDYGFQYFTVGLAPYLSVIENEYLSTYIPNGGSAFKLVVGVYGGGKTHFLYCIRELAWKHSCAVSYVSLKPGESPFHRLDLVYRAIAQGLMPPLSAAEFLSGYERGIRSFLRRWYATACQADEGAALAHGLEDLDRIESLSFRNAVVQAFHALRQRKNQDFADICQWLELEGYDRATHRQYGILQRIDKTTAFSMIRSLVQFVTAIGHKGLVILFDEAERVPSLSTKQREQLLTNLRELIDECAQAWVQGLLVFYAVPDENFLEGRTQVYEALRQRLQTIFDNELNPTGVKIDLEKVAGQPESLLQAIGQNLAAVYQAAFQCELPAEALQATIRKVAERAYQKRYMDSGYKRVFVQEFVKALHFIRQTGSVPSDADQGT